MNRSEITWKFVGHCADGDTFLIGDINVWTRTWHPVQGEKAEVLDPLYGQSFSFPVYILEDGSRRIRFAAGEFSNNIWGFYLPIQRVESPGFI